MTRNQCIPLSPGMAAKKQISYGLKFQARAMVALPGEGGHSRWLVGTNALRDENEVCLSGSYKR